MWLGGGGGEGGGGDGGGAGVGDQASAEAANGNAAETGETGGEASEGGDAGAGGDTGGGDGYARGGKVNTHHGHGISIGHDVQTAANVVVDIIKRLRAVPGIDIATFDHGSRMMLEGLQTIASAMKRG